MWCCEPQNQPQGELCQAASRQSGMTKLLSHWPESSADKPQGKRDKSAVQQAVRIKPGFSAPIRCLEAAGAKLRRTAQITLGVSQLLYESSLQSDCELFFEYKPLLSLPFLTCAWLFTQPNFLTRLETIQVRVQHAPTLLPSPGVTQLPSFSGNDLASIHSPSGCILPLCVSHFISIPFSNFHHPGPFWCWATLPALEREEAGDLTLL